MRLWYVELDTAAQGYLREDSPVHSMHASENAAGRAARRIMQRIINTHSNKERLALGPPSTLSMRDLGFAVYEDVGDRFGPNHKRHRLRFQAIVRSKDVEEENAIDLLARLA